jgi:hypothetical protein
MKHQYSTEIFIGQNQGDQKIGKNAQILDKVAQIVANRKYQIISIKAQSVLSKPLISVFSG